MYIVASKSGTTGEINAFFQYFWDEVSKKFGDKTGDHFLAITDPGTKLDVLARERKFFKVINANPQVGGRNSALTAFGLVPAALLGIDVKKFLKHTQAMAKQCMPETGITSNPGVVLGALMAEAAFDGLDKLTVQPGQLLAIGLNSYWLKAAAKKAAVSSLSPLSLICLFQNMEKTVYSYTSAAMPPITLFVKSCVKPIDRCW